MSPKATAIVTRLLEDNDEIKREALATGEGVDLRNIDIFTHGYIDALFFTEDDQLREDSGNDSIGLEEISGRLAFEIHEDCKKFQEANVADLADAMLANERADTTLEQAGHDFWLTRNGHGAGFWDGGWPDGIGERLTASSKAFGQMEVYVGDDGKIYGS